mmetsp:Transcript_2514/g.4793  ORF Transcript_2514/g.4793 Transcript_2514/m.4793 type:complete len:332 (+) Transcript_2514:164-1159(+)
MFSERRSASVFFLGAGGLSGDFVKSAKFSILSPAGTHFVSFSPFLDDWLKPSIGEISGAGCSIVPARLSSSVRKSMLGSLWGWGTVVALAKASFRIFGLAFCAAWAKGSLYLLKSSSAVGAVCAVGFAESMAAFLKGSSAKGSAGAFAFFVLASALCGIFLVFFAFLDVFFLLAGLSVLSSVSSFDFVRDLELLRSRTIAASFFSLICRSASIRAAGFMARFMCTSPFRVATDHPRECLIHNLPSLVSMVVWARTYSCRRRLPTLETVMLLLQVSWIARPSVRTRQYCFSLRQSLSQISCVLLSRGILLMSTSKQRSTFPFCCTHTLSTSL